MDDFLLRKYKTEDLMWEKLRNSSENNISDETILRSLV